MKVNVFYTKEPEGVNAMIDSEYACAFVVCKGNLNLKRELIYATDQIDSSNLYYSYNYDSSIGMLQVQRDHNRL